MHLDLEETIKYGTATVTGLTALIIATKKFLKEFNKPKKKCDKCGLCKNKLFALLKLWIKEVESDKWRCLNDYKTAIAKDMIKIKFLTALELLPPLFCKISNKTNKEEAKIELFNVFNILVEAYRNKWRIAGIPEIIQNDVDLLHDKNINNDKASINHEFSKDIDINDVLRHSLNIMIGGFARFLQDVREVIDSTNGRLKDDIYKGIKNTNEYSQKTYISNSFESDFYSFED